MSEGETDGERYPWAGPAIRPVSSAATRAFSSTTAPRPVLINMAPGFI
jgi:hypothetical protein